MHLKKTVSIIIGILAMAFQANAQEQSCNDYFKNAGKHHYAKSEYQRALYNFRAMETCDNYKQDEAEEFLEKTRFCIENKEKADRLFEKENYDRAMKFYEKILEINPKDRYAESRIEDCHIFAEPVPENMVLVKGGTMQLGTKSYGSERPPHEVTLSTFYISKTEVTNAEYAEFLNAYESDTVKQGDNKGKMLILEDERGVHKKDGEWIVSDEFKNYPVIYVSWYGAQEFCKWKDARLPTEAEWEYAARGGQSSKGYEFSGSSKPGEVAWYYENANKQTQPVSQKKANELDLYDMSGNVYEWVYNWYAPYTPKEKVNPTGPKNGDYKVIRGGSWFDYPSHLRVSNRNNYSPDYKSDLIGFRYAKTPTKQNQEE